MCNACKVSNREFLLVNTERLIVFVMSLSRLHKLNITLRPHSLDYLRIGVQPESRGCLQFWLDKWSLTKITWFTLYTPIRTGLDQAPLWVVVLLYGFCIRSWQKNSDSPDKYCFAFLNDDKISNNQTQQIIRWFLLSSMDTEPSATFGTTEGCVGEMS